MTRDCYNRRDLSSTLRWPLHTDLCTRIPSRYLEVVKLLLKKGADVTVANNKGWTPLNSASDNGHLEVVKFFLEKGADMTVANNTGRTAILVAAWKGHEPVVNILLDHGSIVMATGGNLNALLNALAYSGLLVLLRLLIEEYNVDYNQADSQGRTALILLHEVGKSMPWNTC